jgi:hypothetical protein
VFGYRFGVLRRRRPAVGARFPGLPRFGLVDCRWVRLARALATLGHWRDLPPSVAADQQREIARGGYPFTGAAFDEVTFPADGEDLAEGGVEELLERMRPVLQRHGVALQVATLSTAESIDDDYVIAINGRRCLVLGPDDWRYESPWYEATIRPLSLVNDLLADPAATVRVFTLHAGGNDGLAILIDPRIVDAMAHSGLIGANDLPILPRHDTQ